jgi:myo-inositol-1(or 4)-monophosphatase
MIALDDLERVVRQGAAEAVARFGRTPAERKADGSIVTEADRAVQRAVVAALRALEPDPARLAIVAEEDGGAPAPLGDPLTADVVAALDPVDGTTAFASGLPLWTVSLGLLVGRRPVAGIIHAPLVGGAAGWLYRVGPTGPATLNGVPLRVAAVTAFTNNSQVAVTSSPAARERLRAFGGKVRSLGSTAHHLAVAAAGLVDAAIVGRPWLWDLAAGAALVERAGGVLETLDGAPPDWDALLVRKRQPAPLLVGAPGAVAALRALLAAPA